MPPSSVTDARADRREPAGPAALPGGVPASDELALAAPRQFIRTSLPRAACTAGCGPVGEHCRTPAGIRRTADEHARTSGHPVEVEVLTVTTFYYGRPQQPQAGDLQALTSREQEIARMVASGLSNGRIAARLFISKRTVDAHVEHIFRKLGVTSRLHVAAWVRARGEAA